MVAGVMPWWNNYEVQILVLASLVLQLFLLMFAWSRCRWSFSIVAWTSIWLAYLLADSVTIYALGFMSFRSRSDEHQQLVAFWAPFLLVHLGGQDTITALDMEDNQLWLRHLLNLVVQTVGVAYVLYRYIAGSGSKTLLKPAMLVLVAGFLKYGDRVWALKSSSLNNISKFLDDVEKPRVWGALRFQEWPYDPLSDAQQPIHSRRVDSEEVLQGAHDLLPICMGELVDYKFWPSPLQSKAIMLFFEKGCMYELIEMQLSLMHELLYTKAAVVHTWSGYFIRAFSSAAVIFAFFQFQSSASENDFNGVDVIFTYILLAGALLLETAAVLRAILSSWTCALLSARRWHRLHNIAVSVHRCISKAAPWTRWSGSIGQRKLLILVEESGNGGLLKTACNRVIAGLKENSGEEYEPRIVISGVTKELVLKEILRMVEACEGKEEIMRTYNGQCALKPYEAFLEESTSSTDIDFDNKIVTWHCATETLILFVQERHDDTVTGVAEAVRVLSSYMMFLLVEHPNILPSPVRSKLSENVGLHIPRYHGSEMKEFIKEVRIKAGDSELSATLVRGAELAGRLLEMGTQGEVLQVVLGVWVEMLCYAAHHCSRDSHARLLHCGGEFITIVWLLSTTIFNRRYCDEPWFKERMINFFHEGV